MASNMGNISKSSIIMGIDPGFSTTGYSIVKKEGSKVSLIEWGGLKMKSQDTISSRVKQFYDFINNKIDQYKIDTIAIETPFLGKNAQNFLKLGYLRGNIYLICEQRDIRLYEFSPSEIKLSITGSGYADKEQVARVVLKLFWGLKMPEKHDITDSLAIALCGAWTN